MTVAPEAPGTSTDRAVAELRRLIFDGELAAGSDHLEAEIAARLGMSRTPVRAAALVLEAQGLVALRPRRGLRILPVSARDMAEIYDVLIALETQAVGQAAARGLAPAHLQALETALAEMEAALAKGQREDWARADDRFHRALMGAGGNRRSQQIAEMMTDQVRRARTQTLYLRPLPTRSNADHRHVLDAMKSGDATRAEALHRAHRQAAKALLIGLLETHNLRHL